MSYDADLHNCTTDLYLMKICTAQLSGVYISKNRARMHIDGGKKFDRIIMTKESNNTLIYLLDRIESGLSLRIHYRDNDDDYNRKSRYDGLAPKESSRQDDQ